MSQEIKDAVQETSPGTGQNTEAADGRGGAQDTNTQAPETAHGNGDAAGTRNDAPDASAEEEDFGAMLEDFIVIPRKGQTLKCPVTDVTNEGVFLNLSSKQTGLIPAGRLAQTDEVKPGDVLSVVVTKVDNEEGYVYCDITREKTWMAIDRARISRTLLECEVTNVNKGGVDAEYHGVHIFIPGSKSGMGRDEDKTVLIGKTVQVRILETNRKDRRVIAEIRSNRAQALAENAKRLWDTMEVGQKVEGTVKNLTQYAAFIDIGGIDALAHVSQLSFDRVGKPSDILRQGDKVTAWITQIDLDKRHVHLTLRDPDRDVVKEFIDNHSVGDRLSGTVQNLTTWGAFIKLAPGVEGLVRVSQIAYDHVDYPSDVMAAGDTVNVEILEIDRANRKIALTMKGIDQPW